MKKALFNLVQFVCILSLLVSLQACGSRGGSDSSGPTTDTPADNGTTITTPVSAILVSASSSAINPGESTTLTVTLFDSSGQLLETSKEVAFSLNDPTLGFINSPVTVSNGFTNQTFTARTVEGTVDITASVDGVSATQTIQISTTVSATTVNVASNPPSVTLGGTTVVSATVLDGDGNAMPDGTTVNFSVDNTTLGTIVSSAKTTGGIAKATFSAGITTPGTSTVTAISGVASGSTTISINGTTAGSIEFLSATPQIITIKGAGGQETSEIKFLVKDSNGDPIVGSQTVRLVLSGPNGGEYLGSVEGTEILDVGTSSTGEATIILHSGTIPGTATVTATVLDDSNQPTTLSTSSGVIAIGGGTPSAGHFSLSVEQKNIAGADIDNLTTGVLALLADRYGNYNVLEGTTVSFYSECGGIDRAVALDDIGQGTVTFRTQEPRSASTNDSGDCGDRCDEEADFISEYQTIFGIDITKDPSFRNPRDGLCTITAVVDGEEEFTDTNANGLYDSLPVPEPFTDTYDDINIEMDDDPANIDSVSAGKPHDPLIEDLVVDRDGDGFFDGFNGIWDQTKRIAARIDLLITDDDLILRADASSISVPNGGSQTIQFALHDLYYNRPEGGSTLTVSLEGAGTLSGKTEVTFKDSNALGTDFFSVTVSDADPSTVETKAATLKFSFTSGGIADSAVISGFID